MEMTIFLTTQYLEEADELADRVAIINHGAIVAEGTPEELKTRVGGESINVSFADEGSAERARVELAPIGDRVQVDRQTVRLYLSGASEAVPAVVSRLDAQGLRPQSLTLSRPTLDDVFLQVTGERYAEQPVA
jgi:ABC-2 type transport system ATP-binding protein